MLDDLPAAQVLEYRDYRALATKHQDDLLLTDSRRCAESERGATRNLPPIRQGSLTLSTTVSYFKDVLLFTAREVQSLTFSVSIKNDNGDLIAHAHLEEFRSQSGSDRAFFEIMDAESGYCYRSSCLSRRMASKRFKFRATIYTPRNPDRKTQPDRRKLETSFRDIPVECYTQNILRNNRRARANHRQCRYQKQRTRH